VFQCVVTVKIVLHPGEKNPLFLWLSLQGSADDDKVHNRNIQLPLSSIGKEMLSVKCRYMEHI
jgi:hypothetical protein